MSDKILLGIDISKDFLDIFIYPLELYEQFPNDKKGHKRLCQYLENHGVFQAINLVVLEASGTYHRAIVQYLHRVGLDIHIANPLRTKRFAQSMGILAKTDKVDAKMLALYGAHIRPPSSQIASEQETYCRDLLTTRFQLVSQLSQTKVMMKSCQLPISLKMFEKQCNLLEKHIQKLDDELLKKIALDAELQRKYDIVCSIKSVGKVTALVMLFYMPELGTCNEKQIAALAGVAPFNRDSGKMKGKRYVSGGRGQVRSALYMAAVCAIRCNTDLRNFYKRLSDKNKPGKVALTAVMRKLLILANALIKQNRFWTENYQKTA